MPTRTKAHERALAAIDRARSSLDDLSQRIHRTPELGYQEKQAATWLVELLSGHEFAVQRPYAGVETAYRADAKRKTPGPTVGILSEYDALPDIGHACGHNLIAIMGAGAAIGAAAALETGLAGTISAIGTPAEEGGGGKVALLRGGGFKDVDAAMMVHPSSRTLAFRTSLASDRVDIEFTGKSAHAAAQPDRGINALDGVIMTFTAVNAMRQQLRSDARVHGIITNGGSAPNIIPDHAVAKFSVRALDRAYQQEVLQRFIACAEGAAKATGAQLKVTVHENSGYATMVPSTPLGRRWADHLTSLGVQVQQVTEDERMGSTDMGNISQALPAIHPYIAIASEGTPGHSTAFRDAAATPRAFDAAIDAAKAMALVAVDLLSDARLLDEARAEFDKRRKEGIVQGR